MSREPGRAKADFEPLADALAALLDDTPLGEALERAAAVDQWAGVVGPRVSSVARAVEVRGRDLVVEVSSSAWIAELSMMRATILEKLNEAHSGPSIAGLRFRLAESQAEEWT